MIVFGQAATLSGTLSQAGAPMAGQSVALLGQEASASAFSPLASATTDGAGAYTSVVRPAKLTTYKASYRCGRRAERFGGGEAPGHIAGAQARYSRNLHGERGPAAFGPSHSHPEAQQRALGEVRDAQDQQQIQLQHSEAAQAPRKYQFRARTAADADHLAGVSKVALVDAQRVTLSASVKGRTVTLSGRVAPSHPGQAVVIKVQKGGSFVRFAKLKLSRRSTFVLKRRLARGTYAFRADRPGDRDHFPGKSPVRTVSVR